MPNTKCIVNIARIKSNNISNNSVPGLTVPYPSFSTVLCPYCLPDLSLS